MLAELVDVVIGVDTHKDTHTAAVMMAGTGAVLAETTVTADPDGYAELLELGRAHGVLRGWAIEGSGGYGAGLARHLALAGELVVELDRPARPARRTGRSPTRSTRSAPHATRWPGPGSRSPAPTVIGPRCRSGSPPARPRSTG
jgi:hypothetical protein